MRAYYNEFDAYAAQWLRNLITGGYIAPGDVDERSIKSAIKPSAKGIIPKSAGREQRQRIKIVMLPSISCPFLSTGFENIGSYWLETNK